MLILISWIFIIPFVTKDFSSKFTKNLVPDYSLSDRIFYVLSKFVYIVAFCVLYMLLQFIVEIIFNYTLGEHCMHKYEYEYNYGFTGLLFKIFCIYIERHCRGYRFNVFMPAFKKRIYSAYNYSTLSFLFQYYVLRHN